MAKRYVTRVKGQPQRERGRGKVKMFFHPRPENAAYYETREAAEADCVLFDSYNIEIETPDGTHVCKGFKVEARGRAEFVIFHEGPST